MVFFYRISSILIQSDTIVLLVPNIDLSNKIEIFGKREK